MSDAPRLDGGSTWPAAFALTVPHQVEARLIGELVPRSVRQETASGDRAA